MDIHTHTYCIYMSTYSVYMSAYKILIYTYKHIRTSKLPKIFISIWECIKNILICIFIHSSIQQLFFEVSLVPS